MIEGFRYKGIIAYFYHTCTLRTNKNKHTHTQHNTAYTASHSIAVALARRTRHHALFVWPNSDKRLILPHDTMFFEHKSVCARDTT